MLNSAAADAAGASAYLARFVPNHRRQLLRNRDAGAPGSRTLAAAVLYVDIVGFTALTGQMTQNLAVGAEAVAEGVNAVLTGIAAIAARHGGEVMHFAGDAAWIGWFAVGPVDLPRACHLAAAAALAVRGATRFWQIGGHPVALRASIGAGALEQLELGGYGDRWCGLLRGPAIADAVAADGFGAAGAVVASPSVYEHLRGLSEVTPLAQRYVRIEDMAPIQLAVEPSIELHPGADGAALPEMIAHRARGGEPSQWSGEFRTCHIVFGRLEVADSDIAHLHQAVGEIQRLLDRTNGSLYQLLSDEKGLALIAAYGLPPQATGNDGIRALEGAVLLNEALAALGVEAHFGVAVGRVFCTTYGADNQLQFALVGPAVNKAARLPDAVDAVSADAAIVEAGLSADLAAAARPPKTLKGFADPAIAFAITRRAEHRADSNAGEAAALVGRADELAQGIARLASLVDGQGGLLLIEGDPGAGKSTFASALVAAAAARSLPVARGGAEAIERTTEYRPWRQVCASILADVVTAGGGLSNAAAAALGDNRPYAGLLSRLFNLQSAPGGAETRLTDEARATLLRQMVVDLLTARSRQGPFVLLLEDLHWFDSPSLALLEALLEAHLPILVVATSRDAAVSSLLEEPGRDRITLGGLELVQSSALLARTCNALRVDAALAAHVHDVTAGNPLFVTQLGRFLLDHGRVQVIGDQLVGTDERLSLQRAFETHGVPSTLEGVVMARLDALPAAEGATVRAASVLGGTFGSDDLAALIGSSPDLSPLIAAGILVSRAPAMADFRHAILRDVAYSTLSLADRRRLHSAAARLMAAKPEAAAGQLDAVLAHHLEQAGDIASAIKHGLRAGASLLRGNANREALDQLVHALGLLSALPAIPRAALRETEIDLELGAGEAAQRLSLYDQAVRHKDMALAALGGAVPVGAGAIPALVREVVTQIVRRRAPWLVGGSHPGAQDLRLSAETAELVEIYFYRGESLRSLYAALRALNLAEGGGDTPQLARGFGIVGTIAGFARLSGVARTYGEKALDVLSRIDDPGAAWWVPLVVGVSRLSAGDLSTASRLMQMTAVAAERIRDRRHWRDAIGNQSIISGLRGDWNGGLELSHRYSATALEDRDTRYIVSAAREQAYFLLQLGRLDEAEQCLARLRLEIERGLKAEEAASRQDLHAIGAAIALARGDSSAARREAEAGYAVLVGDRSGTSFPNMFWSISLLFDAFLQLAALGPRRDDDRSKAWTLVRALDKHAASHLIGRPAALRARGLYERTFGWAVRAGRWFDRAAETARALGMAYAAEPALARGPESSLARFIPPWLRRGCSSR